MSPARSDGFNHALHTADVWLADIGNAFGTTGNRHHNERILRTWLRTLRDRLTVEAASKFGQQLPELLRGIYLDGWEPHRVPVKYSPDQYVHRFATEAGIPPSEVPSTAATVTEVIAGHMSPGQLAGTLAQLPAALRGIITGTVPMSHAETTARPRPEPAIEERIAALESQVSGLTEAVHTLAHGFEDGHFSESGPRQTRITRAARLADEILIATTSASRAAP